MVIIYYNGADPALKDKRLSISVDYIQHQSVCASAIPTIKTLLWNIPYDVNGDVFNTIPRGDCSYLIHWKVVMDIS